MDDPEIDEGVHRQALRGLARLNALSRPDAALWRAMRGALPAGSGGRLRVLDVACGGGEVATSLQRRAAADGVEIELLGLDRSATAIAVARERAAAAGSAAAFERRDASSAPLPGGFDVVFTSLFLHHLHESAALALLRAMGAAAGRLVLVDDLARGAAGLALATAVPWLVSRSPVVHADARRSVRAAFTPREAASLAAHAGLRDIQVRRHWPQRFLLRGAPAPAAAVTP